MPKSSKFPQARRTGGESSHVAGEKPEHLLFPLIIGQSLGLDARFGDQIASLIVGRVKSRTRGGAGEVAPAGRNSREEETN